MPAAWAPAAHEEVWVAEGQLRSLASRCAYPRWIPLVVSVVGVTLWLASLVDDDDDVHGAARALLLPRRGGPTTTTTSSPRGTTRKAQGRRFSAAGIACPPHRLWVLGSSFLLGGRKKREPSLYSSIAVASILGFFAELVLCLWSIAKAVFASSWKLTTKPEEDEKKWDVAFYCGHGWIPGERRGWDASALAGGCGGSEQCVIRLARALHESGLRVCVYNSCARPAEIGGVRYQPAATFDPLGTYGHVVVWRLPQLLLAHRLATALFHRQEQKRLLLFRAATTTYWVHDGSNLEILRRLPPVGRSAIRYAIGAATKIVYPSRPVLEDQYEALTRGCRDDDDKTSSLHARTTTIPHGVPRYFSSSAQKKKKKKGQSHDRVVTLLWPVSVERGLNVVLRHLDALEAAAVRGGASGLRLAVCHHPRGYHGLARIITSGGDDDEEEEEDPRVEYHGMLGPRALAEMYATAQLFVFPSAVPEAFSLSAWECAAHGVVPVVYGLGALTALADCGAAVVAPGDEAALVAAAAALLRDPGLLDRTRAKMLSLAKHRALDWPTAARRWQADVFHTTK